MNSTCPSRSRPNSAACGSFTLQMTSPRSHTSSGVAAIWAPARRYSSSVMADSDPAPAWTTTVTPWWTSSDTPSGVRATRYSLTFVSLGTPTTRGRVTGSGTVVRRSGVGSALIGPPRMGPPLAAR